MGKKILQTTVAVLAILLLSYSTFTVVRADEQETENNSNQQEPESETGDSSQSMSDTGERSGATNENENQNQNSQDEDDTVGHEMEMEREQEQENDAMEETDDTSDDSTDLVTMSDDSLDKSHGRTANEQVQAVNQEMKKLSDIKVDDEALQTKLRAQVTTQEQIQTKVEDHLNRIEARRNWVTLLMGPDYDTLDNLRGQVEQNQLQIKALLEIKTQLANQADQDQIQATVQALNEQNTILQDRIAEEEGTFSLFGWLFRWLRG